MRSLITHTLLSADIMALLLLLLLPTSLLLTAATHSSSNSTHAPSHTAALPNVPDASAWAAALHLDTSRVPCSCTHPSLRQQDYEPFTHCYWACEISLTADFQARVMQSLGSRFKACAVSLIAGEDYLEGAAVMVHSCVCALIETVTARLWPG